MGFNVRMCFVYFFHWLSPSLFAWLRMTFSTDAFQNQAIDYHLYIPIHKLITARKRSLGQGNVFTLSVTHSVHRRRGGVGGVHPPRQTPPFSWADTPNRLTPPIGRHPPWPLKRAVHVLLECVLVQILKRPTRKYYKIAVKYKVIQRAVSKY